MLVHDGPLLETRISHVPARRLKCDTQALFRLANVISSCSMVWLTNEVDQTFVHRIQNKFSFFSKTHFITYVIFIIFILIR